MSNFDLEIDAAFARLSLLVDRSSELLLKVPHSVSEGIPKDAAQR
jgi:hypothetical protein